MMHPHSPSPPQLAVPGIGFPQNFSVAQGMLDSRAFRDWSDDRFDAPPQRIDRIAWRPSPRQCWQPDGEKVAAASGQPVAS